MDRVVCAANPERKDVLGRGGRCLPIILLVTFTMLPNLFFCSGSSNFHTNEQTNLKRVTTESVIDLLRSSFSFLSTVKALSLWGKLSLYWPFIFHSSKLKLHQHSGVCYHLSSLLSLPGMASWDRGMSHKAQGRWDIQPSMGASLRLRSLSPDMLSSSLRSLSTKTHIQWRGLTLRVK